MRVIVDCEPTTETAVSVVNGDRCTDVCVRRGNAAVAEGSSSSSSSAPRGTAVSIGCDQSNGPAGTARLLVGFYFWTVCGDRKYHRRFVTRIIIIISYGTSSYTGSKRILGTDDDTTLLDVQHPRGVIVDHVERQGITMHCIVVRVLKTYCTWKISAQNVEKCSVEHRWKKNPVFVFFCF